MARIRKVLIVEDEAVFANNLRRYLESHGWMARVAGTGVEAIETCATFQPCVISLDYGLPDMTGIEALSFMRLVSASPCIMITGHSTDAIRSRHADAGISQILSKPCGLAQMNAALASACGAE